MPQISDFYGLIIWIYWDEDKSKHKSPHIHAEYSGAWAVLSIPDGDVLEADAEFPAKKIRMVQTWIDIHAEVGAALLWRICYLVLHCHTIIFQLLCQPPQYVANLRWEGSKSS